MPTTSSIADMPEATGGRQPVAEKPPCNFVNQMLMKAVKNVLIEAACAKPYVLRYSIQNNSVNRKDASYYSIVLSAVMHYPVAIRTGCIVNVRPGEPRSRANAVPVTLQYVSRAT